MRSGPQVPLPLFPPSATVVQACTNGSTPVAHRNHSHVERDPHGSGSGVLPLHHAHHMGALPLHYRCTTVAPRLVHRRSAADTEERIPRNSLFAHWPPPPNPKDENIQQPTANTNIQCPLFPQSLDVGCSMLVVGCFPQFPRSLGSRGRSPSLLRQPQSGISTSGSRARDC